MYKVIEKFKDKDGKIYEIGDKYESDDKDRLNTLSSTDNAYKRPFIEKQIRSRKKKVVEKDGE